MTSFSNDRTERRRPCACEKSSRSDLAERTAKIGRIFCGKSHNLNILCLAAASSCHARIIPRLPKTHDVRTDQKTSVPQWCGQLSSICYITSHCINNTVVIRYSDGAIESRVNSSTSKINIPYLVGSA